MIVLPSVSDISGSTMYTSEQVIRLSCEVEAYPKPSIIWVFNTQRKIQIVLDTSRISILNTYLTIEDGHPISRSRLIISHANSKDSGDYLCIATTDNHDVVQSRVHSLTVTSKSIAVYSTGC